MKFIVVVLSHVSVCKPSDRDPFDNHGQYLGTLAKPHKMYTINEFHIRDETVIPGLQFLSS